MVNIEIRLENIFLRIDYLIEAPLHNFTAIDGDYLCELFTRLQKIQQLFLLWPLKKNIKNRFSKSSKINHL